MVGVWGTAMLVSMFGILQFSCGCLGNCNAPTRDRDRGRKCCRLHTVVVGPLLYDQALQLSDCASLACRRAPFLPRRLFSPFILYPDVLPLSHKFVLGTREPDRLHSAILVAVASRD